MKEDPEVRLDKSKGQIIFPRGRAFLPGSDVWSAMKLKQNWDPETVENLRKQWVNYGRELGERMWALIGKELDITFDILEQSATDATDAGWGILKIEGDKNHGTHLTYRLSNCVFCEGLKGQFQQPCCYEFSGTIKGVIEVLFGNRTVKEVKYASGPWDVCEVEVTQG